MLKIVLFYFIVQCLVSSNLKSFMLIIIALKVANFGL